MECPHYSVTTATDLAIQKALPSVNRVANFLALKAMKGRVKPATVKQMEPRQRHVMKPTTRCFRLCQ